MRYYAIYAALLPIIVLIWIGLFWVIKEPDLDHWTLLHIVATHLLPPLALWCVAVWILIRKTTSSVKTGAELVDTKPLSGPSNTPSQQRQKACDCRSISLVQLGVLDERPIANTKVKNIVLDTNVLPDSFSTRGEVDIGNWFVESLRESLADLYSICPTAATLPTYVALPEELDALRGVDLVVRVRRDVLAEMPNHQSVASDNPHILPFAQEGTPANDLIDLLNNDAEQHGIVVLGFDSPAFRKANAVLMQSGSEDLPESEGLILMLLTRPDLDSAGDKLSNDRIRVEQLLALPVLGKIFAANTDGTIDTASDRAAETYQRLLLRSIQESSTAFATDAAIAPLINKGDSAKISRFVHNISKDEKSARRLAMFGNALQHLGTNIDPTADSVDFILLTGNLGQISALCQLGYSLIQAVEHQCSVLSVDFGKNMGVSFFVIQRPIT